MRTFAIAAALVVLAVSSGCIAIYPPPDEFRGELYTQVTMKPYRGNQIGHTNFLLNHDMIPAGTPVQVVGMTPGFFLVDINGFRYQLCPEQHHAWNLANSPMILDKYFGPDPPPLPAEYSNLALGVGALPAGLTREEVLTILGYPAYVGVGLSTENLAREQILAAENWYYFMNVWRVKVRIAFVNGRTVHGGIRR
jgi:hypothetical protein